MIVLIKSYLLKLRYSFSLKRKVRLYNLLNNLNIISSPESIKYILDNKCSISRFGEGEFLVMGGHSNGFQRENEKLATRLKEVMLYPVPNHIVGIPSSLKDRSKFKINSQLFILEYLLLHGENDLLPYVNPKRIYLDSLFTRFYMPYKRPIYGLTYIELLKNIWVGQDILIIEGRYSRLGVGNNLFSNVKSVQRILGPEHDAFVVYDVLLAKAKQYGEGKLILLALGMTATVLAYDLAKIGYQALDIGHIDLEYEWFRMKAKNKCPVPGKMVSEIVNGKPSDSYINEEYENQIIARIYDSETI